MSISIIVKAGRWSGVVAAFITMSDIKDEIDWEFPGNATNQGQTNFFWQGVIRGCLSSIGLNNNSQNVLQPTRQLVTPPRSVQIPSIITMITRFVVFSNPMLTLTLIAESALHRRSTGSPTPSPGPLTTRSSELSKPLTLLTQRVSAGSQTLPAEFNSGPSSLFVFLPIVS